MEREDNIYEIVRKCYWEEDINCAAATLKILSSKFGVALSNQVLDSALGMHGAGRYGAQCGLVEGMLMFLGIFGRERKIPDSEIVEVCWMFAKQFEERFSSLLCRVLRPEGFHPNHPPHLCEGLTCDAMCFDIAFVQKHLCRSALENTSLKTI